MQTMLCIYWLHISFKYYMACPNNQTVLYSRTKQFLLSLKVFNPEHLNIYKYIATKKNFDWR